jgi:hypothetical protein
MSTAQTCKLTLDMYITMSNTSEVPGLDYTGLPLARYPEDFTTYPFKHSVSRLY